MAKLEKDMRGGAFVYEGACSLRITVMSNCPKGGDGGHGGITMLQFENLGGAGICASFKHGGKIVAQDNVEAARITFLGDDEHNALLQSLRFAVKTLEDRAERAGKKGLWSNIKGYLRRLGNKS